MIGHQTHISGLGGLLGLQSMALLVVFAFIGSRRSDIVNVPLILGCLHETMALVEAVRWTVPQRAEENRHLAGIGLRKEAADDERTDASGLAARMNIKMVQVKPIVGWTECVEADALSVENDELRVLRIERLAQAIARSLRIETPDLLQTGPHRSEAESRKLVEIGCGNFRERDADWIHREFSVFGPVRNHALIILPSRT